MKNHVVLILSLSLLYFTSMFSQVDIQNIDKIKVDDLSDIEIQNFVSQYSGQGYTFADVEIIAKNKWLAVSEIEKLRQRVQKSSNEKSLI